MTSYDRHQMILQLLEKGKSLRVVALAGLLEVSEGTIRNDLRALEMQGLVKRIRGGVIAAQGMSRYPLDTTRASSEKQRIAKWAAELVNEGDVILLDASSIALQVAHFLQERRQLSVVTNQLEAARLLARDSRKTVILLGGILNSDGSAVTGSISQDVLKDLHITTAFVSCAGVSLELGLLEVSLEAAHFKEQVIRSAARVVALVDSSKFGKAGLKPFASFEALDQLITDDAIPPAAIKTLQDAGVILTLCGDTVQTLNPHEQTAYRIGFANLSEQIPFAVDVRRGLERAAKAHSNIDLIVADNALNGEKALAVAEDCLVQDIDLMIEYQIDETVGNLLMNRFREKGIPVIAVDIPMVGAIFCGADNYQAGLIAGKALGHWLLEHWRGEMDKLLILEERRAGPLPAARIQGQLHGLEQVIGKVPEAKKIFLDSGNTSERSYQEVLGALDKLDPHARLAVISFNDDAALGALQAVQETAREARAAIIGQGADRRFREAIRQGSPAVVGSTAFKPECYGDMLIGLALKLLKGEPVPPAVYVEHSFITRRNITEFYAEE